MQGKWVAFKDVKRVVTMQMLLDHYGVDWLRSTGDELRGRCPLHNGEGERAFHVNLAKDLFLFNVNYYFPWTTTKIPVFPGERM